MVFNFLVHFRMCKIGLILFTMAKSSVPNYIDKNVLVEFLSISDSNLHTTVQEVRLISVDMQNRGADCFGDLSTII